MGRRRNTRLSQQCSLLIVKWIRGQVRGGFVGPSGALLQPVKQRAEGWKKRRKDYANGELRLDTPANSEALGCKPAEGLTFRTDSITSRLPVTWQQFCVGTFVSNSPRALEILDPRAIPYNRLAASHIGLTKWD